jgi:hypothetical protein
MHLVSLSSDSPVSRYLARNVGHHGGPMWTPIAIPATNVIENMYLILLIGNIEATNDSHAYGPKNSHVQCSCGTKSHNFHHSTRPYTANTGK